MFGVDFGQVQAASVASMGIYVFATEVLIGRLRRAAADIHSSRDFRCDARLR
jgi:ADP-glucose pyrophosphorylase